MSQLSICLTIFALTLIGYCSGKYSLATFAIASMLAMTFTGCLPAKTALACFSNANVILVAGISIVAAGFNRTSFCVTLAKRISLLAKGSLTRLMVGYVSMGILLSQLIPSPISTLTIVTPMLLVSAEAMGLSPSKVLLPVGIAIITTCVALPIGGGAAEASLVNAYLESYGYTTYSATLFQPMISRLPILIVVFFYCSFIAPKYTPDEPTAELTSLSSKRKDAQKLTPFQEYAAVLIFFATAIAMMLSSQLGIAYWQITVTGALLMIFCKVLTPKEASAALPMKILLLIVGALGISSALSGTGAGNLIGSYVNTFATTFNGNRYIVGLIFFAMTFILTQFMSNRAAEMIFIPIVIAMCASSNLNPIGLLFLLKQAALAAFMTPMATTSIPYMMGNGGYSQKTMIVQTFPIAIIACIVTVGWNMTVFPLK